MTAARAKTITLIINASAVRTSSVSWVMSICRRPPESRNLTLEFAIHVTFRPDWRAGKVELPEDRRRPREVFLAPFAIVCGIKFSQLVVEVQITEGRVQTVTLRE